MKIDSEQIRYSQRNLSRLTFFLYRFIRMHLKQAPRVIFFFGSSLVYRLYEQEREIRKQARGKVYDDTRNSYRYTTCIESRK